MSKSLEFCKSVATDSARSNFLDRDFRQAEEFGETKKLYRNLLDDRSKFVTTSNNGKEDIVIHVTVDFDPNADFDYYTSAVVVHDGTLMFVLEAIEKCLIKVATAQTYCLKSRAPKSGDSIHYTIGNAVVLNEYGDQFAPPEKPWMQERTTVLLPIKYEVSSL